LSEVERLSRAAGVVGSLTVLSRVSGLVRDMLIGYLIGAEGAADAFFVAFRIPNLLRRLTAEGALSAGFIPVVTHYLTERGRSEAIEVSRIIVSFAIVFLLIVTLLGITFPAPLVQLFAPGFAAEPEKFTLTVELLRTMFPYIFFVSLVAMAMGYLNTFRHFLAPALAPVLLNVSIIVCAVFLTPLLSRPTLSLGYGVLFGGMAQLALQLPYLRRYGFSWRLSFQFGHPALIWFLKLMGPAVLGAAVYQINVLMSTVLASTLAQGSVSYLYYADRLLQFPLGVFAVALGTAALPSFASLVSSSDFRTLRETLGYSLRMVNLIALPAALGLMVTSVPLFSLLFQRGAFDAQDVFASARALVFLSLGLWAISLSRVLVPLFYALKDTRTPMWVGFISFLLNLVLSIALMGPVEAAADADAVVRSLAVLSHYVSVLDMSYAGLALANSLSALFQAAALIGLIAPRIGGFPWTEFYHSFWRNGLCALLMALPLWLVCAQLEWTGRNRSILLNGGAFAILLGLGVLSYFMWAKILRSPDWPIVVRVVAAVERRLRSKERK
jgi:putative peptidoglycan lipid II flippase